MQKNEVMENLMDEETRNKLSGRVEVLDKVKELFLLPKLDMMTVRQVAEYYEVEIEVIKVCYSRNKGEIDSDGTEKRTIKSLLGRELQNVTHVKHRSHTDFELDGGVTKRGVKPLALAMGI